MRPGVVADLNIEYPDSDGEPMADNSKQFNWIVTIKVGLEIVFRGDPNVAVCGNMHWYPVEGDPKTRAAPDVFVAIGRPQVERGSYKQWLEDDIAPQVAFEILSPGNSPTEMEAKLRFYERHGVEEYYIYDPETNDLEGYVREGAWFAPIEPMDGWVSPLTGIRFDLSNGLLEIYSPTEERFERPSEYHRSAQLAKLDAEDARHEAAEAKRQATESKRREEAANRESEESKRREEAAKAEVEMTRRQAETVVRDAAERDGRRIAILAEKLRSLGIDPEAIPTLE